MSCSKAPLTSTTTAAYVQLANSHTTHHTASSIQQESISTPTTSQSEDESENEEEIEFETASPVVRMPMLPSHTTPYSTINIAKALSTSPGIGAVAGKNPLDKSPLWLQNPILPAARTSSNPLFIPTSSFGGKAVILPKSTAVTSAQRVPMMYKLMSPSCMARSLLAPVLTVLPSPTNAVTPPASMFLPNHIGAARAASSQSLPLQPVIMSTTTNPARSPLAFDNVIVKPVKQVIAEPATGQTVFPHEFSPVSSTTSQLTSSPQPRTLASIPPSELTPQHIELKAFAENFKTRRIRLGFTQGAVGQSLAERGFNNFAQSTISRFEQMQLSPTNAATIRVILEKWLVEAECPESASIMSDSSNNDNNGSQLAGRKRKKRAVFTTQTRSILDEFFTQNPRPNRQAIETISQKLDLLLEEVRVWFCNKRQKSKGGHHRMSFDHESSHSTTSSGAPSPTPSEGGMSQKRWSPSPPKTPFTIEALSKSSVMSSIPYTAQMSTSTVPSLGIVASVTHSTNMPLLFSGSQLFGNPILPQFITSHQI